jgi:type I restriction enzyme S subunit
MYAQTFLANFATIADAPGGVQRLKELVVDLAVTGRLAPVLERPGSVDGDPGRLGDVVELISGQHLKPNEYNADGIGLPYLTGPADFTDTGPVATRWTLERRAVASEGDVLLTVKGAGIGKLCVLDVPEAAISRQLMAVRPSRIDGGYLALALASLRHRLRASQVGIAIPGIGRSDVLDCPLSVPTLAEQELIVAKVDELIELCVRLEARRHRLGRATARLRSSALYALTEAETPDDLRRAWERVSANWSTLTDDVHASADIRQAILQLAVQGRLVSQDASDGSASAEVAQARKAKSSTHGLRRQPSLLPVETPSAPLPDGWTWATVDEMFLVTGGIQKSSKRRPRVNHWPYLRVANVQRGRLDLREIERFELFEGELDRLRLQPGDLLVVEGNGSESEIGRCARWDGEIEDCVHQNHLIRCRPMLPDVEHYLLLFLNSPAGMETMKSLAVTTSGLYNLSVAKIRSILFPLPPLAEQARIRRRVDELMRSCDGLTAGMAAQELLSSQVAAASIDAIASSERPVAESDR